MKSTEQGEHFLELEPPYSKSAVAREGKKWRKGKPYDPEIIDEFLDFHAAIVVHLLGVTRDTIASLLIPLRAGDSGEVEPDSGSYILAARVKTTDTLLEKLKRMPGYSLDRIQDVAGLRFDCDLTLREQTEIARIFAQGYRLAGAKSVDIRDHREQPRSGYRGVHVHVNSKAGRAEVQIRTALQSKWANLYEEVGDIFGRSIRYLEFGEQIPENARQYVEELHEISNEIKGIEERLDQDKQKPAKARGLSKRAYGILDTYHARIRKLREDRSNMEGGTDDRLSY